MPRAIGNPCREPGCPAIVHPRDKYCEQHRKQNHRHNVRRNPPNPLYRTAQWQRLRKWHLRREPMCRECDAPGEVVDHIKQATTHPDLKYEASNLQTLCHSCHNKKRQREGVVARTELK